MTREVPDPKYFCDFGVSHFYDRWSIDATYSSVKKRIYIHKRQCVVCGFTQLYKQEIIL